MGASVSPMYVDEVRRGAGDGGQMQEGAIAGSLPRVGTLVCCGGGDH
jgi:hypothetical protein